MKPTSIIFLVISLILFFGGFLTCRFAEKSAEADGIKIFAQEVDENNNSVFNYDFSNLAISKFEIIVNDADINIIGGAEESRIELINFTEGLYSFNVSGKIITLNETPDLSSMLKFWENGFNFNGLRHLIKFGGNEITGDKSVNIYLTPNDAVKIFNLSSEKGNISLEKVTKQADYNITCNNGKISVASLKTSSEFNVTGKNCSFYLDNSYLRNFTAEIKEGDINATKFIASNISIKLDTGDVIIDALRELDAFGIDLACKTGNIKLSGENKGNEYFIPMPDEGTGTYSIMVKSGDISLE